MAEKSFIDSLFDKAEEVVGNVEKMTGYREGVWRVDEIIDNDTGAEIFTVTDGRKHFSSTNKEDADWLKGVLEK